MNALDAHEIAPRLWQGAFPPRGPFLRNRGFDVLVLCAYEKQPPSYEFPGVVVIRAPLDDSQMTPDIAKIAARTASTIAKRHRDGANVLVTCAQGKNRSGLVMALTLHQLTGRAGKLCRVTVQTKRPDALFNRHFVDALDRLPAVRPPR